MKQSLSSLNFILKADIGQFQSALRQADKSLLKTGQSMKLAGGVLTAGITAPVAAATAAMFMLASKSAEFADTIDEMSIRTGVAKSTLQELSYVSSQVGIDFPAVEKSLAKLNKSMGDAATGGKDQAEAFAKLGVSVTDSDGRLRSMSDIFPEVIGKLGQMGNESERNYLQMQLFGRGANEVITPLTALGEQGMKQMIDRAHELGVVMSDEGITALAEYNDAMASMKEQVSAAGREMSVGFAKIMTDTILPLLQDKIIPAITALAKWFSDLPSGIKNTVLVVTGLVAVLGPVLLIFGKLITVIPTIIAAAKGMSAAMTVLNAVMDANPIGAIIVAVAALVAIFIYAWNNFEGFRMFLYGLWESFKAVFTNIKDLAKNVLGGIGEMLVGVFTFDMDKIKEGLEKLKNGFSEFGTEVANAYKSGAEKGKDLVIVTEEVDGEVKKLTDDTKLLTPELQTLEQQISALEAKLWAEVQASDATANSTARLLKEKKDLLQVYKDQMELMLNGPTTMTSIKSNQTQVNTDLVGPAKGDILFKKETEQLKFFNDEMRNTTAVAVDVGAQVQDAFQQMGNLVGETLGNIINGTAKSGDLFQGLLEIIGSFLGALGSAMIAAGTAGIAMEALYETPVLALAAGIALKALAGVVTNMMKSGLSGGSGGGGDPVQGSVPGLAEGGIVSKPTLIMAGEGAGSEAILPIGGLMNTIHNAISMNGMNSAMKMGNVPVTVKVQVEGKMRAGEMYLMNRNYQTKLNELK